TPDIYPVRFQPQQPDAAAPERTAYNVVAHLVVGGYQHRVLSCRSADRVEAGRDHVVHPVDPPARLACAQPVREIQFRRYPRHFSCGSLLPTQESRDFFSYLSAAGGSWRPSAGGLVQAVVGTTATSVSSRFYFRVGDLSDCLDLHGDTSMTFTCNMQYFYPLANHNTLYRQALHSEAPATGPRSPVRTGSGTRISARSC